MSVDQPFSGAEWKVKWAFDKIGNLDKECAKYIENSSYRLVIMEDRDTMDKIIKIKNETPIPEEIYELVGVAIYHLRSSLDQLTVSLGKISGVINTDHLYFPFEGDREKFLSAKQGRRKIKGLKPDLVDIFNKIAPYKGGNDQLFALSHLANVDKHNVIFPVGAVGNLSFLQGVKIQGAKQSLILDGGKYRLDQGIPISNLGSSGSFTQLGNNSSIQVNADICFGNTPFYQGARVVPVLYELADIVGDVVRNFKMHCIANKYI